jgi:hypothetical protein
MIKEATKMINTIKWALEVCNQEGYKTTSELEKAYNIELLGC